MKNDSVMLTLRLQKGLIRALNKHAKANGKTRSALIRDVLQAEIRRQKVKAAGDWEDPAPMGG